MSKETIKDETLKKERHPVPDFSDSYDYLKASSATDCTGVVPRAPQDSAELDSYLDVYNFLPQYAYANPNDVEIDMLQENKRKETEDRS